MPGLSISGRERTALAYEFSLVDAQSAPVSVRRRQARIKPIVTTKQHDSRELARVMMVLQLDPTLSTQEKWRSPWFPLGVTAAAPQERAATALADVGLA
jgi:hypothetical protein